MAGKTWKLPPLPSKPKWEPPKVDWQSGGSGADVFFQMEGMEALQANLDLLPVACQDAAGFAMETIAGEIITDARDLYVPYKFGALRDSAGYDEYKPGQGIKALEIGMWFAAGGSSGSTREGAALALHEGLVFKDPSVYAELQHEETTFEHPVVGPVATPSAKYLEIPFMLKTEEVPERIARAIDDMGGPNIREMSGVENLF